MEAVLDAMRKLQEHVGRQEMMLRHIAELLVRAHVPPARAATRPSWDGNRTDDIDLDSPSRWPIPPDPPPAGVPVQGQDALADHERLAAACFPHDQRQLYQDRWRVQPVVQRAEAGQFVLKPPDTDDEAMMWVLVGASNGESYPVVLAPAAYEIRMTESNNRPLRAAAQGFFVTAQVCWLGSADLEFRDQTIGPTGQCL
jgi:hypothetical protein